MGSSLVFLLSFPKIYEDKEGKLESCSVDDTAAAVRSSSDSRSLRTRARCSFPSDSISAANFASWLSIDSIADTCNTIRRLTQCTPGCVPASSLTPFYGYISRDSQGLLHGQQGPQAQRPILCAVADIDDERPCVESYTFPIVQVSFGNLDIVLSQKLDWDVKHRAIEWGYVAGQCHHHDATGSDTQRVLMTK